ncbi:unnamed protein product [Durusdinium trenchii]|uniref:Uncharacterized protein n=1 Tax=Durusdinium trenchii TaxID=1381693 RepID=A0ABP0NSK2_9DINO
MAKGRLTAFCYACCPFLLELLSPREIFALGITFLIAAAALLFGLSGRQRTQEWDQEELMRWSAERWEEARCFVQEVGIEYTGDCNLRVDEEELPFDYGAWPPVKKSSAEAPQYNYTECPEAHQSCSAGDSGAPELAFLSANTPKQGINMPRYNLVACRNSFLPWAALHVDMGGRSAEAETETHRNVSCGYKMGFTSPEESIPLAQRVLHGFGDTSNAGISCWVLDLESKGCRAVALQAPEQWPIHNGARHLQGNFFLAGLGVCLVAVAACGVECCCSEPDVEEIEKVSDIAEEEEVPQSLSARIRRVQQRWNLFQVNLIQHYEPLSSAREMPSARTGRVGSGSGRA